MGGGEYWMATKAEFTAGVVDAAKTGKCCAVGKVATVGWCAETS